MEKWEPKIAVYALATRVLAVATTRIEGTWKAYVDSVNGICHRSEIDGVLDHGTQLREDLARVLFPGFKDTPYAR